MRIVFMGTPDFAVPSLQALLAAGHTVCGVFCQPDKPQGRHQHLTAPPVKALALSHGLSVFQPATLKTPESAALIATLDPELIVVAAYGKLLPPAVLAIPLKGCINVHGSLLPLYRGAAPIQHAVMDHRTETGVTIMQMAEGMDTGDLLLAVKTPIAPDETAGELFDRLALLGAAALTDAVSRLDTLTPVAQDSTLATWASPLTKEDGLLAFNLPAALVYARLRGVTPWPGGFVLYQGKRLKILKARLASQSGQAGTLLDQRQLIVGCGQQSLHLLEVALEGAKRMQGDAFINGQRLKIGDSLF